MLSRAFCLRLDCSGYLLSDQKSVTISVGRNGRHLQSFITFNFDRIEAGEKTQKV